MAAFCLRADKPCECIIVLDGACRKRHSVLMSEIDELLRRARSYAERSHLSMSTISRKILGNGKRLAELEAGKSLRVDTLAKALAELDRLQDAA